MHNYVLLFCCICKVGSYSVCMYICMYGTVPMQVYNQVWTLDVSLMCERSNAFQVLVKHVCSLTTYLKVISITCKCNHSIHFLLESTSQVECQSCMQANIDILHFVTVICFFSHRSTTNIIVTILFFLMFYATH